MKYYSLAKINKLNCKYNLIFGLRSNGKTYSILEYCLDRFVKYGEQCAIVRRYAEDFKGKRGRTYFDNLMCNGNNKNMVRIMTNGQYDRIIYYSGCWYLGYWDEELQKNIQQEKPFAYAFGVNQMEHDKSTSYPLVTTIFMDEFITRTHYINDEFLLFMNVVSTIVRNRSNVKIYMAANTVSFGRYNPYFKEMGLNHVSKMQPGDIDVYTYGDSKLRVAVEYCDAPSKGKPSDVYFAFDNPKLKMITGGEWELDIYPHLTEKYNKKDIIFSYFILFDEYVLQADIIITDRLKFTYIHLKTSDIKRPDDDIIYSLTPVERHNCYTSLVNPCNDITKKIVMFFKANKVFYQSNDIGEIVNQYLLQCNKRYT